MLHATPFTKKKMAKKVEILANKKQSKNKKIYGNENSYSIIVKLFNAMTEVRMKAEYQN